MSILQLVIKCTPQTWQVPLELSPLPDRGSEKGLWIDPVAFLQELNGWALAQWAVRLAQRLKFRALPKPRGPGHPQVYRDESVLLTSLVAAAWRLSYEVVTDWTSADYKDYNLTALQTNNNWLKGTYTLTVIAEQRKARSGAESICTCRVRLY